MLKVVKSDVGTVIAYSYRWRLTLVCDQICQDIEHMRGCLNNLLKKSHLKLFFFHNKCICVLSKKRLISFEPLL